MKFYLYEPAKSHTAIRQPKLGQSSSVANLALGAIRPADRRRRRDAIQSGFLRRRRFFANERGSQPEWLGDAHRQRDRADDANDLSDVDAHAEY